MRCFGAILVLALLFCCAVAAAENEDIPRPIAQHSNLILLRKRFIDVREEYTPFLKAKRQSSLPSTFSNLGNGPEQLLVKFSRPMSSLDYFLVENVAGVGAILSYIPVNTYLVQIPKASMRIAIQEIEGVEWIGPLTADVKVSDSVKDDIDPRFDAYGLMLQTLTPCHMRAEGSAARSACTEEAYQTLLADFQFQMLQMKYQATMNISSGATGFLALKWNPAATIGTENLARQRFTKWASSRLEVHFVDIMPAIKTGKVHNFYAGPLVKSRDFKDGGMLRIAGLQGEGQIVGVSDTGIDYDHCFFWDPANPIPFNTINLNHRKIVYYDTAMGDNKDLPDGHGTHISGTLAGNCVNSSFRVNGWRGIAPLAKIAFIDMASNSSRDLNYPSDLGKDIYSKVMNTGARIMSESWGGEPQGYPTSHTQMMDQFQYENMNFLIVRSAGNEGDHFSSLNTQGVSKNSVVVGASMSSNESYVSAYTYFYDYVTPWVAARNRYCQTNLGSIWCNRSFTTACCDAGSPFYSVCCYQSKLDQMRRNSNLYNIENMVPSSSKGPTWDARIKPDVVAPGEYVTSARSDGDPNSFQTADPAGDLGTMLLALSGTSMSTPLVAGAAAIIREYFVKGYYPSGRANPADSFEPSASLMKAMLINSARPLTGLDYEAGKWVQLPVRNSYYVGATFVDGFGAIALDRVLNFNSTNQNFQLVLPRTKDPTISMGEANSYCYDVVQPGLVTVSLVWTEHPGSPLTVIQLINNLDLIVMRSTVQVGGSGGDTVMLYGNMPFDRFGNVQNVGDVLNNVERLVNIPVNPGFSIRVNISGTNVPFRGQPYSVVVTSTYPPNFSPPYPGQALVPVQCSECFGSERSYCHIPNGNGQKRCVNGKWADCLVVSCNADYTVDAWQNRCKRFMQYYQVNLIASAGMGLIAAWFCLPFYIYDRRRVKRDERSPHAVSEAEASRREAGPWEMYTVVKPNLALVILGSLIGLGAQTSTLIQPLFVGKLIQQLNENVQWVDVRNTLFLVIMSAVAELLLGTISGWIMQVAEEANLLLLRHRLYETIMSQRYSFFERRDLGELQNRLVQDCSASVGFPSQFLSSLFGSLSRLIVALIMIFSISPHLSFVFLLMVPIFALIAYVFGRLIQPITVKQFDLSSKSATIAWDCLKNIRVVKAYGQIAQEIQRYKTATTESYDLNIKISVITTLAKLSNTSLTEAAAIVFLWYGSILVLEPRISTGLLLSFTLYVGYAVAGCSAIFNLWPAYKRTVGAMDKVFAILRLRTEPRPDDTPMKALSSMVADPKGIRGEMSLQNLSFHYEGHEHKMVIKRMNVEMKPGKLHIVTGPSGAGKSTFFNLLTRLYDPTSGSVIIDGSVDISTLRTIDLIAMISIIEQEPKIFNRTVQENLTYGSPETSDWRIEEISKLCNVHDFVIQLPEAYQTVIGEDSTGVRLSGGQKQRICMARALMKDCRVLLLDEPTNDLDIENEKLLLDIIYQLAKNKLVILITHHLNLIREHESVVYFMEGGVIREQGSHSQLMALRGRYHRFVTLANLMQHPDGEGEAPPFYSNDPRQRAATRQQQPTPPGPGMEPIDDDDKASLLGKGKGKARK